MKLKLLVAGAFAALSWSVPANAVPIATVGQTEVTVSETFLTVLTNNDIAAAPIEGASQTGASFFFDITGGETDPLEIDHSGGVEFSKGLASLTATNFKIKGTGTVSANVNGGSDFVDIFDLANVDASTGPITADLLINFTLSQAIMNTFFPDTDRPDDSLEGIVFGSAVTSPTPVPLPASSLLLVAGVGGLFAMRRRKSNA